MEFGTYLRRARERAGLTLHDVAKDTKISMSVLEALERDDHTHLPGGLFTRAFIRNYAARVGLDPAEAVRLFLEHHPAESEVATQITKIPEEETFESHRQIASVALSFSVISALVLVLFFVAARGDDSSPAQARSQATSASPTSESTVKVPEPQSTVGTESPPQPEPAAPEPTELTLTLHPVAPCWAKVSAGGREQLARLVQPGEQVQLRSSQELTFLAGDAAACTFSINGSKAQVLGGPGQVVQVRINLSNYRNFLPR
jgi:cytoskeletal protein RodZ